MNKKLIRFVCVTKNGETEYYQVQYEKIPMFSGNCGMLGHWYQECGIWEHDESKLEWGDFILVDGGRGRDRGRGQGRGPGRVRGNAERREPPFRHGRGRGCAG